MLKPLSAASRALRVRWASTSFSRRCLLFTPHCETNRLRRNERIARCVCRHSPVLRLYLGAFERRTHGRVHHAFREMVRCVVEHVDLFANLMMIVFVVNAL